MNSTRIKLAATKAAQAHAITTGAYSYAFQCGVLEGEIDKLCNKLGDFMPPASGQGEREMLYAHDGGELVVYYDIEESDDEVGYTGGVTINAVYANGMDIQYLLAGTAVMDQIEEQAAIEADEQERDSQMDAAEHYSDLRRDDAMMEQA